jgi:hypothetical protein
MAIRANQNAFVLSVTPNTPQIILKETLGRKGLVICNNNAAAKLFVMFGTPNQLAGVTLLNSQLWIMDFVTPTDALWISSDTTLATVAITEMLDDAGVGNAPQAQTTAQTYPADSGQPMATPQSIRGRSLSDAGNFVEPRAKSWAV